MSVFADSVKLLVNKFGIPVIPIPPKEKGTKLKDWPSRATIAHDQLLAWYKTNPNFNTGAVATPEGICILDADDPLLREKYQADTGLVFPETFTVKSSKGFHYYFHQTDASRALGNKKKKDLFDFQQSNKYVVGPHSVHPSGAIYTPNDANIVAIPDDLVVWINNQTNGTAAATGEVTQEQKERFEKYLGPEGHNENFTDLGYDGPGHRWAYSINTGCPYRDLHTNPDTCALDKEFLVYMSPTGPQAHCVHTSCEMTWGKYRDYLIEKSGQNFPLYETTNNFKVVVGVWDSAAAELEADLQARNETPKFPDLCFEGSYIGDLAKALTDHTFVPPVFAYAQISAALGLVLDSCIGFPFQPAMSMRHYVMNVSAKPQCGKDESRRRVTGTDAQGSYGVLRSLLLEKGVILTDGNVYGSGQALKLDLSQNWSGRHVLMGFAEMQELYSKCRGTNNILESVLLQLFDSTDVGQKTVGVSMAGQNVRFSFTGDFTIDNFRHSFEGSSSIGNGLLSRCILTLADKQPHYGDWPTWNPKAFDELVTKISTVVNYLKPAEGHQELFVPEEDPLAKELRNDFLTKIGKDEGLRPFIDRIDVHFKRDLLLRAVFSNNDDLYITPEHVAASIKWAEYQLLCRRKLWQAEGKDAVACLNLKIMAALQRHRNVKPGISASKLCTLCDVYRDGNQHYFERAIKSLAHGSGDVVIAGVNREGYRVYALREQSS